MFKSIIKKGSAKIISNKLISLLSSRKGKKKLKKEFRKITGPQDILEVYVVSAETIDDNGDRLHLEIFFSYGDAEIHAENLKLSIHNYREIRLTTIKADSILVKK